jgi:hypothetical protein
LPIYEMGSLHGWAFRQIADYAADFGFGRSPLRPNRQSTGTKGTIGTFVLPPPC